MVTSDAALAARVRLLREYGWAERYVSHVAGFNSRLDELQAAILRVKLSGLDAANAERARLASVYDEALAGAEVIVPARREGASHAFHLYVVRSSRRDELLRHLHSGTEPARSPATLGKVWGRVNTGRGSTLEVRIGWVAGVQYLQFVEAGSDTADTMPSPSSTGKLQPDLPAPTTSVTS